jgi:Domain of unknown function (DUF4333)
MSSFRPLAVVATVGAAVMVLGACSGSVSESDLEERVAGSVFTGAGAFPAVSCDGDLRAEVDATTSCSVFFSDTLESVTVDLTVTSVDGGTVNFDIAPRS